MMTQSEAFLAKIDAFLATSKMKPTAFGKAAVGDPNFVRDLREKDRQPSLGTVDRINAFMASHETSATPEPAHSFNAGRVG